MVGRHRAATMTSSVDMTSSTIVTGHRNTASEVPLQLIAIIADPKTISVSVPKVRQRRAFLLLTIGCRRNRNARVTRGLRIVVTRSSVD